jgi:FlaA1/EpsC-like NDP-sugar epimerase
MGQPVRIYDLASRMVELSGMSLLTDANPEGDIAITGLRPGEKLYEELLIGDDPKPTQHLRIMKAHEDFILWEPLEDKPSALQAAIKVNDVPVIRHLLQDLVHGYQPTGAVVDWVHLALARDVVA